MNSNESGIDRQATTGCSNASGVDRSRANSDLGGTPNSQAQSSLGTQAPLSPQISPWETGPAVVELQELLNAHGFPVKIDGDFGWRTESAVRAFQRQHRLRVDGIVGRETWEALKRDLKPGGRTLHRGHSGADVYELQGLLQVCGVSCPRDGIFGPETEQAVLHFQRRHHLQETGQVDRHTWTMLRAGRPMESPTPQRRWLLGDKKWW